MNTKHARDYRRRLGLSQADLARKCGIGAAIISKFECHGPRTVRPATLRAIAAALGTEPHELWDLEYEPSTAAKASNENS